MYSIDTPPPTISGHLHMGHLFSYTQIDFASRFKRLKGQTVLFPFCYDNNGLPTEKLGNKNGYFDPEQIRFFSNRESDKYIDLFRTMQIGFSDDRYNTYDNFAKQLCLASFEDLKQKGLLYKKETDYYFCPKMGISISQSELDENGCFERSGEKAILKRGEGWFIDILNHIPEIRDAINQIEWHPEMYKHRLMRWLDDLQFDWSISRERKYGIQIPGENLTFDTWFISSLSPQMAYSSYIGSAGLRCPTFDIRYQGHDIIRTWALFTIIKSLYHNNQIPWRRIIITGHALDPKGHKISKSAGNFIPPYNYIEKYGSNGIRYWAAHTTTGSDTKIDENCMSKGKKLINKIKNAYRFLQMQQPDGYDPAIAAEWKKTEESLNSLMENHEWSSALTLLRDFFWNRFCDEFIEKSKITPAIFTLKETMNSMLNYFEIFFPDIREIAIYNTK